MDMTQSPVVIAPKAKLLERTRRIPFMAIDPAHPGMKQPDIGITSFGCGIGHRQVLHDGGFREALPMNRHAQLFEPYSLGAFMIQEADIVGKSQSPCHFAGGVMIPGNDNDRNLQRRVAGQADARDKARVVIAPIAIIKVARDQNKINGFVDGEIDQPRERASSRSPNPLDGRVLVPLKPLERTIEVDIGRVDKRDRHKEESNPLAYRPGNSVLPRLEPHKPRRFYTIGVPRCDAQGDGQVMLTRAANIRKA